MKYSNDHNDTDYDALEKALFQSESIAFGRPDQYQYYQNQLSKQIANFILKPYRQKREEEKKNERED